MPIRSEIIAPGNFYHIYNRGVNKDILFHDEQDYNFFLKSIKKHKEKTPLGIIVYCLMPNHFHFIVQEPDEQTLSFPMRPGPESISQISHFFHNLQVSYAMYFNKKYKHSGYVFQGRYQMKLIEQDAYLQYLSAYIHYNPRSATLVNSPLDWSYSSLKSYISGQNNELIDVTLFPYTGDYSKLFQEYMLYREQKEKTIEDYIIE